MTHAPEAAAEQLVAADELARYRWACGLAPGRRALDAGCGLGDGAALVSRSGAAEVVGVDGAEAIVEAARRHTRPGLTFARADLASLPFGAGSFDLVTCFGVLDGADDPAALLAELARVLSPDGVLAVSWGPGARLDGLVRDAFASVRVLVQREWIASGVFEQDALLQDRPVDVRTTTGAGQEVAPGTCTVVLAGHGATLPEPPPAAVMTGTVGLHRWLERVDELRRLLADKAAEVQRLEQHEAERRELRAQLAASETDLAHALARAGDLEREHRAAVERLEDERTLERHAHEQERAAAAAEVARLEGLTTAVWRSPSWRVTRPLRAAKGLARRLRRG